MSDDPIITVADFRRVYCVSGVARRMVAAQVNWKSFVQNGLPLSQLRGHGYDAMIDRVVAAKRDAETKGATLPRGVE